MPGFYSAIFLRKFLFRKKNRWNHDPHGKHKRYLGPLGNMEYQIWDEKVYHQHTVNREPLNFMNNLFYGLVFSRNFRHSLGQVPSVCGWQRNWIFLSISGPSLIPYYTTLAESRLFPLLQGGRKRWSYIFFNLLHIFIPCIILYCLCFPMWKKLWKHFLEHAFSWDLKLLKPMEMLTSGKWKDVHSEVWYYCMP